MTMEKRHVRKPHIGKPPLVSWTVQSTLRDDVADSEAYTGFIRSYTEMWPRRYGRLAHAIRVNDWVQAMDAALSLRSSSEMLGAVNLARLALAVEQAIRSRQLHAAGMLLPGLKSCGEDTMSVLLRGCQPAGQERTGNRS
jgi:HPt (histidine-containing phosphotransfer) domain-containing protein